MIVRFDRPITYTLLTILGAALAWEIYARLAGALLIPTVGNMVASVWPVVTDQEVWMAFLVSNQALAIGFGAAVVMGIPVGLLMGRVKLLDAAADPYLSVLLVTPLAGIIPLLLMSVGLNLASRAILVFLFALPMVVVNTRVGARQVSPVLIDMGRSYLANEAQIWRHILLPGALPGIIAGLHLAVGRAVGGMVIGELLLVAAGIGGLVLQFTAQYQPGKLYVVIVLVVLESLLLSSLVQRLQESRVPWSFPATGQE